MGTHPIFESDFDCLTDRSIRWFLRDELHSFLDDDLELAPVPLPTRALRTMLPSSDRMALSMCSRNGPRPSELVPACYVMFYWTEWSHKFNHHLKRKNPEEFANDE